MKLEINLTKTDYRKLSAYLMGMGVSAVDDTLKQDVEKYISSVTHDHIKKELSEVKTKIKRSALILKTIHYLGRATNKELSIFLDIPINQVTGRVTELLDEGFLVDIGTTVYDHDTNRFVRSCSVAPSKEGKTDLGNLAPEKQPTYGRNRPN